MNRGVRQGCVLGPTLFLAVLHYMIKASKLAPTVYLPVGRGTEILPNVIDDVDRLVFNKIEYADDMVIVGKDIAELTSQLNLLEGIMIPLGVRISAPKTKVLALSESKAGSDWPDLVFRNEVIERVNRFCYLGCEIDHTGKSSTAVCARITSAKRMLYKMKPAFQAGMSRQTRTKLIKSVVLAVLFYGSETWAVNSGDIDRLEAFLNLCRLAVIGKSRFDKIPVDVLSSEVRLPNAYTLVVSRKIRFASQIATGQAARLTILSTFAFISGGKGIGARRKQAWEFNLKKELEWLHLDGVSWEQISKNGAAVKRKLADAEKCTKLAPRLLNSRVRDVACHLCSRKFAETKELNRHLKSDHAEGKAGIGFGCPKENCTKMYKTTGWLERHIRAAHPELSRINNNTREFPQNCSGSTQDRLVREESRSGSHSIEPATQGSFTEIDGNSLRLRTDQSLANDPPGLPTEGPPYRCRWPGCVKSLNTLKGIINHGSRDHNWSFLTKGPKRARRGKDALAAGHGGRTGGLS